ncbi:hypothetical protein EV640_102300 [Nesterenkonia aurantiaca]|uniref:Uncharacterized protein n=1 Tax=Nesterenkonia aurantiaca TaxID=1436010 RepID=A0A4R7G6D3_9MICC|nr:hypothetical protein EV640_102300 [Nesterenkonia aurantiaca]
MEGIQGAGKVSYTTVGWLTTHRTVYSTRWALNEPLTTHRTFESLD